MRTTAQCLLLGIFLSLLAWPTIGHAQVKGPAPYESAMRVECADEMRKDPVIRAECKAQWTDELREQDFRQITKDNKHVVMAYAAIWIIVMLFVVALWMRQRKLTAEIARLEDELKKAVAE